MLSLQRQITDLALTRSSAVPVLSGGVTDTEQYPDSTARIMSIYRMSEGLSKAPTFYEKGSHFP